jgi:hypothetical protein
MKILKEKKEKISRIIDYLFVIGGYVAAIISIIDGDAISSFLFGQFACLWFFSFIRKKKYFDQEREGGNQKLNRNIKDEK